MDLEDGPEVCLATLLKLLFGLAGSGDQEHNFDLPESFLLVCISYHLELLGVFTNQSLSSTAFLGGYPSASSCDVQFLQLSTQPVISW